MFSPDKPYNGEEYDEEAEGGPPDFPVNTYVKVIKEMNDDGTPHIHRNQIGYISANYAPIIIDSATGDTEQYHTVQFGEVKDDDYENYFTSELERSNKFAWDWPRTKARVARARARASARARPRIGGRSRKSKKARKTRRRH